MGLLASIQWSQRSRGRRPCTRLTPCLIRWFGFGFSFLSILSCNKELQTLGWETTFSALRWESYWESFTSGQFGSLSRTNRYSEHSLLTADGRRARVRAKAAQVQLGLCLCGLPSFRVLKSVPSPYPRSMGQRHTLCLAYRKTPQKQMVRGVGVSS